MVIARTALLAVALALAPLSRFVFMDGEAAQHEGHGASSSSALVETVRGATERFRDVRNVPAEYTPTLGCVSGPEAGAMGVHFVNAGLLLDNRLEPTQPEALIYEFKNGAARLVGGEFIVLAGVCHVTHAPSDPPVLDRACI